MLTTYLLYAAGVALLSRCLFVLYNAFFGPLHDIPGPLLARFTKAWYLRSIWTGQAHWDQIALHRKYAKDGDFYAPVVRLGPKMYSITRPEKVVYGIGSKMPKSSWYEGWKHPSPDRWTLFPDRNMKRHAETRRKLQSMYAMSSLLHYETYVESAQDIFNQRLVEMCSDGRTVDMHHWLQCYAFDVIGNITYSRRFGFLDEGKDIERTMVSLDSNLSYSTLVGVYAWAHPILYKIMEKVPGSGAAGRAYLMDFTRKMIAGKEAERDADEKAGRRYVPQEGVPRDFMNLAMDAERDPEKNMTKYNVFMIGISNIIAGSDTTAVSLSSVLWHLASNPAALQRLRAEIDQAIADGKMTTDRVTFKQSQELSYFQACIKEGLRLCAATGLPLWREVPKGSGGVQMCGHYFPEGSEVGINTWVAHYDEDIWGPDAAQFKPERWIDSSTERLKIMDSFFMPFGLGSRTCIGRHISFLEMNKVIPMIVSKFDFEIVNQSGTLETENYWFVKPTDFRVVVKERA
ncbi:Putative cytochrome P450 [Septoria linicola]|uniref:Cytochrome P450 n=1 Tax=Septoria linicola TaxID=215465 RepID=A0A9Q9ADJ5_9PEZI|nr:Putative cytochrome P450 [Septoria linicola]